MSSDAALHPIARKYFRRNYSLGILNGAIFGLVDALTAPSLVLALFVSQLGGSNLLIGLLSAIYNGGWFLPQFLISHRLQRLELKKRIYVEMAILRIICWGVIALSTPLIGASNPTLLLVIFFALFTAYSFLAGFGGNAFMTMVAKIIPAPRRGSFFGWREFAGTATGLLGGYIVAVVLSPERGLTFPNNFGLLFFIIFVAVALGLILWSLVVEPREKIDGNQVTFFEQIGVARHVWQNDATFRRYLLTRFVLAGGDIATPFFGIYATRVMGANEGLIGLYIGLTTFSAMLSNPLWTRLSERRGLRPVMLAAAALTPLLPLLALVFGFIGRGSELATAFGVVFLLYGAARTAANIAFPTFLLEIAPDVTRSLYIGLTNSLLGIATFIPAIGGILLDLFGFTPLFVLTLIASSVGVWLAFGLRDSRVAAG